MAGTAFNAKLTSMQGSAEFHVIDEYNKLVADLETLRAAFATLVTKLNADGGVTDTDYASVAAVALTAAQIRDTDSAVI